MKLIRKELVLYGVYFFVISILILLLLSNYNYFNIKLLSFVISFYIIGFFIIHEYYKENNIFSLCIIFNVFGLLYTNYYIIQLVVENIEIDNQIIQAMHLSYLSIMAFNIGYIITKKNEKARSSNDERKKLFNIQTVNFLISFLLILSIAIEIYVIFFKIGFSTYRLSTRAARAILMADYSVLSFYRNTIPLVSIISLYILLKYNNNYNRVLFLLSFGLSIINSIITVSRAELISIILPVLFLLNHFKKISNKNVIILGLIGFVIFGAWKGLSYGKYNIISYDSEFNSWYIICKKVLSDSNFSYLFGKSYLNTIINLIVPVTKTTSLSTWYIMNYENEVFLRGGGRGFSGALEAYINFGLLGNIIIYSFYGFLLKKLNKENDFNIVIYMIFMVSIYQFFRSESYSLWKNMMWFKIYPTIIIFFLSQAKRKKDDNNDKKSIKE